MKLLVRILFFDNKKYESNINYTPLIYMHRYDLLCLEGIAQALRIFNGQQEIPTYKAANISTKSMLKMHVKAEVIILEIH